MKIDFDMLDKLAAAGATAQVIIAFLREQDAKLAPKRETEKTRQRTKRSQRKPTNEQHPPTLTKEQQLFKRAKEVLGKTAGGLVSALIKANSFDLDAAAAVIETAAGKGDPREYVVARLRGNTNGARANGKSQSAAADDLIERARAEEQTLDLGPADYQDTGGGTR